MKFAHLAASLTVTGLLGLTATPAQAAEGRQWYPLGDHGDIVVATCADGSEVHSPDMLDPRRNRYSFQETDDGAVLFLQYAGEFTHSTTGQTVSGRGFDRVDFDDVTGIGTSTGNRWTVTFAGEGWLVQEAGRVTFSLADGAVLSYTGAAYGDGFDVLCEVFGVKG